MTETVTTNPATEVSPKPKKNILVWVIVIALAFSAGYTTRDGGWKLTNNQNGGIGIQSNATDYPTVKLTRELPADKQTLDFALFWRVWDTLSSKYYDKSKIVESEMVYGAIKGMVSSVGDPYTSFFEPDENKVVQDDLKGSFGGVGIHIHMVGKQLAVEAPVANTPAERAGIKAGDYIIQITDRDKSIEQDTLNMTLNEAVSIIRGPVGSKVSLLLAREGLDEPLSVELTRAVIDVPSVTLKYVGENEVVAHLRVNKFSADTLKEWDIAVSELVVKPNVKGIIVDVRNNPGGYLTQAVDLASDFLDMGKVVVIEDHGDKKSEFKVEKPGRLKKLPVVVMINGGSASASEIFAGALRDHGKAKLVGEKSFGKGTVQESLQIGTEGGLHVTIARWLTPNGTWVHKEGLTPDTEIENNIDTEEDEQLQEAISVVTQN
jgi:carboxyl-terminal processing protease